jgi:ribonuclease R
MNEPHNSIYLHLKKKKAQGATMAELLRIFDASIPEHLKALQSEGLAAELKKGWWAALEATPYRAGRARVRARKTIVFLRDQTAELRGNPLGAMDGDLVLFRISRGEVRPVRILERASDRLPGFLLPEDVFQPYRRHQPEFTVRNPSLAQPRMLAEGRIVQYPTGKARGKVDVTAVLGTLGDRGLETTVILMDKKIPHRFSPDTEEEASAFRAEFSAGGPLKREDIRREEVFTIDPENARDFDDAVSLKPLAGGRFLLGVHIADVSHYVTPGSALDRDALERGNSVYFPDRVVPMLPEVLSNELCSLMPDRDRYALSVFAHVTEQGALSEPRVVPTLIHSRRRFTYQEVQSILDGAADPLSGTLKSMEGVARAFQERRTARGSLDFDLPEVGIVYDDAGRMTGVRPHIRTMAHRLVEEFMLSANRVVAQWLAHRGFPLLYRVHEPPDGQKFMELKIILDALQRPFPVNLDDITPKDVQKLLKSWEGTPEETYLNELLLRSLMRAGYSPDNKGHFALAFPVYCHFTSPIRRWADLQVHRQIKRALSGERFTLEQKDAETDQLRELGDHISRREWDAEDAEREVLEWMTIQLLEKRQGEVMDARISGVSEGGMTILLPEYMVAGFMPFSGFKGEYLYASALQHTATGVQSGRTFRLGDAIRVRLVLADPIRRNLIFEPEEVAPSKPLAGRPNSRTAGKPGRIRSFTKKR